MKNDLVITRKDLYKIVCFIVLHLLCESPYSPKNQEWREYSTVGVKMKTKVKK